MFKFTRRSIFFLLLTVYKFIIQSSTREPREPKGKRFEKKIEEAGKPSSGKVSLFDFLEDKLPAQSEVAEANYSQQTTDFPVKEKVEYDSRGSDHHNSTRGGR